MAMEQLLVYSKSLLIVGKENEKSLSFRGIPLTRWDHHVNQL